MVIRVLTFVGKKEDGKSGYFLPLEYYFFDEEDGKAVTPEQLIKKYEVLSP